MSSTRYKGRNGVNGPTIGALQCITVGFDDIGNGETVSRRVNCPAGAGFEITHAIVNADAVTNTLTLTIGDSAAGTQVVAGVAIATNTGALTIKDGTIDAAGFADVVLVASAASAGESVSLTLWGHCTSEPTSLAKR